MISQTAHIYYIVTYTIPGRFCADSVPALCCLAWEASRTYAQYCQL